MSKGPGEDSPGGVTFGRQVVGQAPKQAEALGFNPTFQGSTLGYDLWTIDVIGGIAWTKRLTTLTGESPTSSAGSRSCRGKAEL